MSEEPERSFSSVFQTDDQIFCQFLDDCTIKVNNARRLISPMVLRNKVNEITSIPKFGSPSQYGSRVNWDLKVDLNDTDIVTLDSRLRIQTDDESENQLSNFKFKTGIGSPKCTNEHFRSCHMTLI